ncbi:MAG TPA: hypothetical protein VN822_05900 [Candidatus Acidoferrales bacterium]|nr:hypothetical protein [Candidatus Acidoferrales bacterium]
MKSQLTWSLTDFRIWWRTGARYRWLRALNLAPSRNLTNFGDVL